MDYRESQLHTTFIVFVVSTLVWLLLMFLIILSIRKRKKNCPLTIFAEVAGFDHNYMYRDGESHKQTKPEYRFEYQGEKYYATDCLAVSGKAYKVGKIVPIQINPDNPEECFGKKQLRAYYFGIIALVTIPYMVALFTVFASYYTNMHPIE